MPSGNPQSPTSSASCSAARPSTARLFLGSLELHRLPQAPRGAEDTAPSPHFLKLKVGCLATQALGRCAKTTILPLQTAAHELPDPPKMPFQRLPSPRRQGPGQPPCRSRGACPGGFPLWCSPARPGISPKQCHVASAAGSQRCAVSALLSALSGHSGSPPGEPPANGHIFR